MPNPNAVVFKGGKNGITIILDEKCGFEEIKELLGVKANDAKRFFGGAKTGITFHGRTLTEDEELELLSVIAEKANLDISFVSESVYKAVEKSETFGQQSTSRSLFLPEHVTKFHGGSLRSGQSVRFAGSVVILGDVNPGAEVIAEGNIIILGVAKGLVHAGCSGNMECFISAMRLKPTQLRIADIITYIPTEDPKKKLIKKKPEPVIATSPSYAYVKDGQIYIAPLITE